MPTFDPASTKQTSWQEPNVGDESLSSSASPSNDKKEIVSETATEATEAEAETPSSSQVYDSDMAPELCNFFIVLIWLLDKALLQLGHLEA